MHICIHINKRILRERILNIQLNQFFLFKKSSISINLKANKKEKMESNYLNKIN